MTAFNERFKTNFFTRTYRNEQDFDKFSFVMISHKSLTFHHQQQTTVTIGWLAFLSSLLKRDTSYVHQV